jgi:hypothetical protein
MRRFFSLVAVATLLVACGGAGGDGTHADGSDAGVPAASTEPGGNGGGGGQPSGAKVRIVNVYNGGDAAASIDVYAAPWVLDGATPLLSVPYGTVTDFFDPTVSDDQGDMFLSFYRHGETGNGTELISQTETLKGGEIITFLLMSDIDTRVDGTPILYLQALFHQASAGFLGATPEPGTGLVLVSMHGIEPAIPPLAGGESWYLSAGTGCAKAVGNDEFTLTAAGPGDGTKYALAPGDYSLSLHPSVPDTFPDCSTPALVSGIDVTVAADQTTLVVVYAPSASDIRTMVVPLTN